jgi:hypothetical protein
LSLDENRYNSLSTKLKIKRAKLFLKLSTIVELNTYHNLEKVRDYIENHILEDDFEYMSIEDLILLRGQGFLDNSKLYELFPEEFDYLDGIPVLMWDQL